MGQSVDCACLFDFVQDDTTPVALRARILQIQGACIELEVIAPLAEVGAFAEGDVVGGQWQELCPSSSAAAFGEGEEVLAVYSPGNQATDGCPEYRSCSEQRCGLDSNAAGYDACDSSCVSDTQLACAARTDEARVGGTSRLAKLNDETVAYELYGQQQSATLAELAAPTCREEHLARAGVLQTVMMQSSARPATTANPAPAKAAPQCPPRNGQRH